MQTSTISKKKTYKTKLDPYTGKWVAFLENKIIAHNETLKELMRSVDKKGLRGKASVFLVPRKDEGPYILTGIGGRILGYLHEIFLGLGSKNFRCKIVFSPEFNVSFNLLGRNNFFSPFIISFWEKKKKIIIDDCQ